MRGRRRLSAIITVSLTACEIGGGRDCGALGGGCGPTGGSGRAPVVAGFPSARAFAGVGRLNRGDTMTLRAIRVGGAENPCVGADTLKSDVRWGVSNPSAATATPLPDGGVLVRAVGPGNFQMLMREGGLDAPSESSDLKVVTTCPANVTISSIGVAP